MSDLHPEKPVTQTAHERGLQTLLDINRQTGTDFLQNMDAILPDLGRLVVDYAYGEVLSRPGLDLRTRQLVTVAALAAMGNAQPQLKIHIHGALNVGCTREEVLEVLLQIAVYAGIPAAVNGVGAAREIFAERGQEPAPSDRP